MGSVCLAADLWHGRKQQHREIKEDLAATNVSRLN